MKEAKKANEIIIRKIRKLKIKRGRKRKNGPKREEKDYRERKKERTNDKGLRERK